MSLANLSRDARGLVAPDGIINIITEAVKLHPEIAVSVEVVGTWSSRITHASQNGVSLDPESIGFLLRKLLAELNEELEFPIVTLPRTVPLSAKKIITSRKSSFTFGSPRSHTISRDDFLTILDQSLTEDIPEFDESNANISSLVIGMLILERFLSVNAN